MELSLQVFVFSTSVLSSEAQHHQSRMSVVSVKFRSQLKGYRDIDKWLEKSNCNFFTLLIVSITKIGLSIFHDVRGMENFPWSCIWSAALPFVASTSPKFGLLLKFLPANSCLNRIRTSLRVVSKVMLCVC